MITVLWPCERSLVWISSTWEQHLARPGYKREYAGVDLAGYEQPLRPSQFNGKNIQSMWSTLGYGNTIFTEYAGILRTRIAHLKNRAVETGQIVNPKTYMGTMDSTGNSTGTHVHWEVWLKRNGVWQNIDPLDPRNGIQIVNDPGLLKPLEEGIEIPMPEFKTPAFPALVKVKATSAITQFIYVRSTPSVVGRELGRVKPGEQWEAFGSQVDNLGNIWYAVKRGVVIGWAAAYYAGEKYLEEV